MIVDYFDTVYSSINGRSPFATKLKIYSFFRWLIRVVANIVIPISFLLNRRKYCLKITSTTKKEKLIVSLTSFPKRINRLWIVIESIFKQYFLLFNKKLVGITILATTLINLPRSGS